MYHMLFLQLKAHCLLSHGPVQLHHPRQKVGGRTSQPSLTCDFTTLSLSLSEAQTPPSSKPNNEKEEEENDNDEEMLSEYTILS